MLPKWSERPIIVANALNPAFCGEVLRVAIKSYEDEKKEPFPFPLLFIILPIILHKEIRNSLPKSKSKKFYEWVEEHEKIKLFLPNKIKNLVPYSREALSFLLYYQAIEINNDATISVIKYRKKKFQYTMESEVENIYDRSKMLGKWLVYMGDVKTVFAIIGIKP